jgi:hypothetical protein
LNAVSALSGASVAALTTLVSAAAMAKVMPAIPIMKPWRENSAFGGDIRFMAQLWREARSMARRMRGSAAAANMAAHLRNDLSASRMRIPFNRSAALMIWLD